ncbi:hypothetical protein KKB40_02125 [Patescibacteria group bacterium]|nr:hypothetical protein [Patescibacteria group bacterium]
MKDIFQKIANIGTDASSVSGARRMATEIYRSGELPENPGAQAALQETMAQVKRTLGNSDEIRPVKIEMSW